MSLVFSASRFSQKPSSKTIGFGICTSMTAGNLLAKNSILISLILLIELLLVIIGQPPEGS